MTTSYLEITYRQGRMLAAYYYLPRATGVKCVRTRRVEPGMVIDFAADDTPMGIEITAPSQLTMAALNRVLKELGAVPVRRVNFSPLRAA